MTPNADAEPFRFDGDRRGVLLVHGYTGTPFEMRPLGTYLAARGYSVECPRLAGHGHSPAELASTTWRDWYASVTTAFDSLRARVGASDGSGGGSAVGTVAVVGLSLGGLLSLELARERGEEVACVGSLAAPLWLNPWLMRLIKWAGSSRFLDGKTLPKWGGADILDKEMRALNPSLDGFPVRTLVSLVECMDHVLRHLGEVERPAFCAHARLDHTAPFDCLAALVRDLGTDDVEQMVLERSYHCITIDVERDALFARLGTFLERHLATA